MASMQYIAKLAMETGLPPPKYKKVMYPADASVYRQLKFLNYKNSVAMYLSEFTAL